MRCQHRRINHGSRARAVFPRFIACDTLPNEESNYVFFFQHMGEGYSFAPTPYTLFLSLCTHR